MRGTLPFKVVMYLLASIHPATSWCQIAGTKGGHDRSGTSRTTLTVLAWSSATGDEYNDNECKSKTIADYTLGLHGGKYQFGDYSSVSMVGQEFAATLYSGGTSEAEQDDYASERWPAWAVRLSEWTATDSSALSSVQPLPVDGIVKIVNEEMTWERYYAFIVPRHGDKVHFSVDPWVGVLAPRGGQVILKVTALSSAEGSAPSPSWLVVGTETELWVYSVHN